MAEPVVVGKRGTLVIPAALRKRLGMDEGAMVLIEESAGGALTVRPAVAVPIEIYAPERQAAFLLENAVDAKDYQRARRNVRAMGLDPDAVPHRRP